MTATRTANNVSIHLPSVWIASPRSHPSNAINPLEHDNQSETTCHYRTSDTVTPCPRRQHTCQVNAAERLLLTFLCLQTRPRMLNLTAGSHSRPDGSPPPSTCHRCCTTVDYHKPTLSVSPCGPGLVQSISSLSRAAIPRGRSRRRRRWRRQRPLGSSRPSTSRSSQRSSMYNFERQLQIPQCPPVTFVPACPALTESAALCLE
ncbi:hypothetical protein LY78DRAFT_79255 [Colletotrichum sublineola]|nr:hypothetical protein LY78DRAFT_79255 [Colletotrichum sublineola]